MLAAVSAGAVDPRQADPIFAGATIRHGFEYERRKLEIPIRSFARVDLPNSGHNVVSCSRIARP